MFCYSVSRLILRYCFEFEASDVEHQWSGSEMILKKAVSLRQKTCNLTVRERGGESAWRGSFAWVSRYMRESWQLCKLFPCETSKSICLANNRCLLITSAVDYGPKHITAQYRAMLTLWLLNSSTWHSLPRLLVHENLRYLVFYCFLLARYIGLQILLWINTVTLPAHWTFGTAFVQMYLILSVDRIKPIQPWLTQTWDCFYLNQFVLQRRNIRHRI